MNYPAAELRGIIAMRSLQIIWAVAVYLFISFSMVFDILFDDRFIAILTNGIKIESARPEFAAPKQFLDLRMMFEYFLCSNALNYLHNPAWWHNRNTLDKKVHMVFIWANFYKVYLVSFSYLNTYVLKWLLNSLCKYPLSVLCRTNDMIQYQSLIVPF